jgi:hypothetical protein
MIPFLALMLGSATLLLNAQKVKRVPVKPASQTSSAQVATAQQQRR